MTNKYDKKTEINICHDLNTMLGEAPIRLSLLAKFDHAVNYRSSQGMITILPRSRALQPYSVQLTDRGEFDDSGGKTGLVLDSKGLFRENGDTVVSFGTVNTKDLNLRNSGYPDKNLAPLIRDFLSSRTERGLRTIIESNTGDPLVEFVSPRLETFREAFVKQDPEEIREATARLAGCGPGLTPSTDDLLSGYISLLPKKEPYRSLAGIIAETAASKTNDISASLLRRSGEGLFSEDVIRLEKAFTSSDEEMIRQALNRVADFGSSSGCDFLTGIYYSVLDSNTKRRNEK